MRALLNSKRFMFFVVIVCIVSVGYLFIAQFAKKTATHYTRGYVGNKEITGRIELFTPLSLIPPKKAANPYLRGYVGNKEITRRIEFNTNLIDAECFSVDGNRVKDHFDKIDFRIIVITYDRAESLTRLLNSINNAKYGSDKVQLEIWIDRNGNRNVNENVVKTATLFKFLHGSHRTCVHRTHVGIIGQWISVSIMYGICFYILT